MTCHLEIVVDPFRVTNLFDYIHNFQGCSVCLVHKLGLALPSSSSIITLRTEPRQGPVEMTVDIENTFASYRVLSPKDVPLRTGPPTKEELRVYYPPKFTWAQLKTFVNSG
jgi:hypothetical protein